MGNDMSYIDYCAKCRYAFTSRCIPHSRECNAEKSLILAEMKADSSANEVDETIKKLNDEIEKLKAENAALKNQKGEIAFYLEAALEVLNDGACSKNCWKCDHFKNCNEKRDCFRWRLTDDVFNLIYKGGK